jgi:sucrose-6-phosphate hydrolase SacC (GH32 family)
MLDALRGDGVEHGDVRLEPTGPHSLAGVDGRRLDLVLSATVSPGAVLRLLVAVGAGCETVLAINPSAGTAVLDRRRSGGGEPTVSTAPLRATTDGRVELRLLLDHSSLEAFLDGGRTVLSARLYPDDDADGVQLEAVGGSVTVDALTCWPLRDLGPGTGQPPGPAA